MDPEAVTQPDEPVPASVGPTGAFPPVRLSVPAASDYLSLVRTATQSTCARRDFTLDRLDDLTLAVNELAVLLIGDAVAGTEINVVWSGWGDGVSVSVSSTSSSGRAPCTTSFSWTILSSLVDECAADIADGRVTVTLRAHRSASGERHPAEGQAAARPSSDGR